VSRLEVDGGYPITDVTSSGINQDWPFVADNGNRIAGPVAEYNVGLLTIDWEGRLVTATLHDADGDERAQWAAGFDELSF
jgi:alkaline phosphatase D